jgi:hypothetical protein
LERLENISYNSPITNEMKTCPATLELFFAFRWTEKNFIGLPQGCERIRDISADKVALLAGPLEFYSQKETDFSVLHIQNGSEVDYCVSVVF